MQNIIVNRRLLLTTLGLLLVGQFPLPAEQPAWKIGTARTIITPEKPLWMAGYGGRTEPAAGKLQDLWLKALALEDAQGHRVILITFDLLGIPRSIYDRTCAALEKELHLSRAQIMLACSHTHCGPVLRGALLDIYPLDAEQHRLIEEYSIDLERKILEASRQAFLKLEPATLSMGQGTARFAVNRRNNKEAQVGDILKAGGQLAGPVDHSVPVLVVESGGKTRAVVFGYACHNTTLSFQQWCGDYAGFAQAELESRHPETQAMFFMGCGADQNPLPRRSVELCKRYGKELAVSVEDVLRAERTPVAAKLESAYELLTLNLGAAPTKPELEALAVGKDNRARWANRLLGDLAADRPFERTYPYPVQVWRLGGKHWWISLGGEVVIDYALRFKREIDPNAWVTGYANDVMAYIPSLRVLKEGGYEGATSMMVYGMPAHRWAEDVEELVAGSVHRLVKSIAGKKP